ncbi:hypothetical protein [Variovorax sp. RA8]|uniref:hypothetical protein n=1 Tax=Variovorax sp. (strain JCM 16519 / RA8) TaxID=662548 RepID=UPI000AB33B42|nr:hypothetical protein [Variovorax sp. RA8]VTU44478.1 hypothetical protein RA8P2_00166 [Variovorax sp. RA8]
MKFRIVLAMTALALYVPCWAHDLSADIAKFNSIAATKKLDSEPAIAAKLALERAQGEIEQSDVKMVLRIRSMTNTGLRTLGEQPAFLTSEFKRLEAALANPKTNDASKIAAAKEILARLSVEMRVYTDLENMAVEQMKQALQLIESAPGK